MSMQSCAVVTSCICCMVLAGCTAGGNRVGRSTSVQFGTVRDAEPVTLESDAARGALIGGTLGVAVGRSSSSRFNAVRGAAVGGAATAAAEGSRQGIAYTVEMSNGSSTRIVTDQREIRVGDCVAVEQVRNTANIRRTSEEYCDPTNGEALREVERAVRAQATDCERAKDELAKARGQQAIDLAVRKTELVCGG